jgi:hypothetical protein
MVQFTSFGGDDMKALYAAVIFSILSAFVSVFSVTQLCAKSDASAGNAQHNSRGADVHEPRQVVQQWVNQ